MSQNMNREGAQAIVIQESSFIGTAANESAAGKVVTLSADGDLTFHFKSGDKKVTGAKAGTSFVGGLGATGVTSSVAVIIS